MIRSLSGTVLSVDADAICLDVSGFGLEIFASGTLLSEARAGEYLTCAAYLQVSDAGMALFGFTNEAERALFLEITQVKTMGGKLSIALLRHLSAETIVNAILAEDCARLTVPGLGPKRAERICFELRSRVEKKFAALTGAAPFAHRGGSVDGDVVMGLAGLGFSQSEAVHAVSRCRADDPDREWIEEDLMRAALGLLRKK
jgi:Holliday junction DNA helicase RuvA